MTPSRTSTPQVPPMAALSSRTHLFLMLFTASCLASHAAALSRNCSSDHPQLSGSRHHPCPTANSTVACSLSLVLSQFHRLDVDSSAWQRGPVMPPYGGSVNPGVLEDNLALRPAPGRHLPADLGSCFPRTNRNRGIREIFSDPNMAAHLVLEMEHNQSVLWSNISASHFFLITVVNCSEALLGEKQLSNYSTELFSPAFTPFPLFQEQLIISISHNSWSFKFSSAKLDLGPSDYNYNTLMFCSCEFDLGPSNYKTIPGRRRGRPTLDQLQRSSLAASVPFMKGFLFPSALQQISFSNSFVKAKFCSSIDLGRDSLSFSYIIFFKEMLFKMVKNKGNVDWKGNGKENEMKEKASQVALIPRYRRLLSHAYDRSAARGHVTLHREEKASQVGEIAAVSALLGLICTVAALTIYCVRCARLRQSTAAVELEVELEDVEFVLQPEFRRKLGPRQFSYNEMAAATCNFAEDRKIGRGGFGPVYRGYLSDQERHVAVKVLSREQSEQGLKEFLAEVIVMSQLRHRNIIQLVGWCHCRRGLLLVYEFMPGGSLDAHLYNPDRLLTWPERYEIVLGLASALLYLHTDCDQCVVHGDIKPANVMLDASRNAKLGDFGLARLVDHGAELRTTEIVAGTVGYIDPEFVSDRRPRADSDVYSFGVVLLEIASGRRPASAMLNWVRDMYHRGQVLAAADPRLDGELDEGQMQRVLVTGLWCTQHDQSRRPSMVQAMDVLRSEDAMLPVLPAMSGAQRIRSLEERAYGDMSEEETVSARSSAETAYLTTKDSAYLLGDA